MIKMMNKNRFSQQKTTKGLSTVSVVLLLLLAVTLPALALMRTTTIHEQMTSGHVDRARTFQAAEAAIVEAEIFANSKPDAPNSGCSNGICNTPTGASAWEANNFWNGNAARTVSNSIDGISAKYVVEFLGVSTGVSDDCTTGGDVSPDAACDEQTFRYRITVRSLSPSGSEVLLQTNYLVP